MHWPSKNTSLESEGSLILEQLLVDLCFVWSLFSKNEIAIYQSLLINVISKNSKIGSFFIEPQFYNSLQNVDILWTHLKSIKVLIIQFLWDWKCIMHNLTEYRFYLQEV